MTLLAAMRALDPAPSVMRTLMVPAEMSHEGIDIQVRVCRPCHALQVVNVIEGRMQATWLRRSVHSRSGHSWRGGDSRSHGNVIFVVVGCRPVLLPFRMIREVGLPSGFRAGRTWHSVETTGIPSSKRRATSAWLRPCGTFWFEQSSTRVWFALNNLRSSRIQSWFLPLRTRTCLPSYAADVAEMGAARASTRGQYNKMVVGLRETNVMWLQPCSSSTKR